MDFAEIFNIDLYDFIAVRVRRWVSPSVEWMKCFARGERKELALKRASLVKLKHGQIWQCRDQGCWVKLRTTPELSSRTFIGDVYCCNSHADDPWISLHYDQRDKTSQCYTVPPDLPSRLDLVQILRNVDD